MLLKFILFLLFAQQISGRDVLRPGECLYKGDYLESSRGCFKLIMQSDGNLVIYRKSGYRATWATATYDGMRVCMQTDGNFVLYGDTRAKWASGTHYNEGSYIHLQDDGNLVIYAWESRRAIWASNTQTHC